MDFYKKSFNKDSKIDFISNLKLNYKKEQVYLSYIEKQQTWSYFLLGLMIVVLIMAILNLFIILNYDLSENNQMFNYITEYSITLQTIDHTIIIKNIFNYIIITLVIISLIFILLQKVIKKIPKTMNIYKIICLCTYLCFMIATINNKLMADYAHFFNSTLAKPSITYLITIIQIFVALTIYTKMEFVGYFWFSILNIVSFAYSLYICIALNNMFLKIEIVTDIAILLLCFAAYFIERYFKILFYFQYEIGKSLDNVKSTVNNMQSGIVSFSKKRLYTSNDYMRSRLKFLFNLNNFQIKEFLEEVSPFKNNIKVTENEAIMRTKSKKGFSSNYFSSPMVTASKRSNQIIEQKEQHEHGENLILINDLLQNLDHHNNFITKEIQNLISSSSSLSEFLTLASNIKILYDRFYQLGIKKFNDSSQNTVYLEIFFRLQVDSDTNENIYEFIFNDISKTIIIQEMKTEMKIKTTFLAKAAHELKNPAISIAELCEDSISIMNSIRNDDNTSWEDLTQNLNLANNLCFFIVSLVSDFDFISKKENELKIEVNIVEFKLEEELAFLSSFAFILMKKNNLIRSVDFIVDIQEDFQSKNIIIQTDKMRLRQIIVNLISNAIKFTTQGKITLRIKFNEMRII